VADRLLEEQHPEQRSPQEGLIPRSSTSWRNASRTPESMIAWALMRLCSHVGVKTPSQYAFVILFLPVFRPLGLGIFTYLATFIPKRSPFLPPPFFAIANFSLARQKTEYFDHKTLKMRSHSSFLPFHLPTGPSIFGKM
jgi:hypothetical protein